MNSLSSITRSATDPVPSNPVPPTETAGSRSHSSTSSSHQSHAFSRLLKHHLRQNKNGGDESSSDAQATDQNAKTKENKTGLSLVVADDPSQNQAGKPPITGKLGSAGQDVDNPTGQDGADQNASAPLNDLLSSNTTGLNKDAGAMLMALLMHTQAGGSIASETANATRTGAQSSGNDHPSPGENGLAVPVADLMTNGSNLAAIAVSPEQVVTPQAKANVMAAAAGDMDRARQVMSVASGQLAFALRLNPSSGEDAKETSVSAANATDTAGGLLLPSSSASASSSSKPDFSAESDARERHDQGDSDGSSNAGLALAAGDLRPASTSTEPARTPDPPSATPFSHFYEQAETYSTDPVRNVQMQVVGENNRRVDIRLLGRAGALRVSVRSGDSLLNQQLQTQMPELTSRLEAAQYETEVWLPQLAADRGSQPADLSSNAQPAWVGDLGNSNPVSTRKV